MGKKFELHTRVRIQAVSWKRCIFSNMVITFWNCVLKKSKEFHVFFKFGWNLRLKLWKYGKLKENHESNKCQYFFANISPTKARIFLKFYLVVNYYLVCLTLECHEDLCTNVRARVVNARTRAGVRWGGWNYRVIWTKLVGL